MNSIGIGKNETEKMDVFGVFFSPAYEAWGRDGPYEKRDRKPSSVSCPSCFVFEPFMCALCRFQTLPRTLSMTQFVRVALSPVQVHFSPPSRSLTTAWIIGCWT